MEIRQATKNDVDDLSELCMGSKQPGNCRF
jgi:hypothetical protein